MILGIIIGIIIGIVLTFGLCAGLYFHAMRTGKPEAFIKNCYEIADDFKERYPDIK